MATTADIEGQLNETERRLLTEAITTARPKPKVVIEVGTWLGGGSTIHILRALEQNGEGHLWGIEADPAVYARMIENIRVAAPEASHRFTPLFGYSEDVLPKWLAERGPGCQVDFVFLDGGNNPREQIVEFKLLDPHIPVGGQLMAHDAKLRKGKWLVPYLSALDNWQVTIHDTGPEGLLHALKVAARPTPASLRRATLRLFMLQCNPIELAAAVLPSSVCGFVLKLLPRRFARGLSDGRWQRNG
ncbi:MAG: class I SAM-dependent methyltransferase [Verrucomicrobiae bacterium]|nr:class I SAM-dependent methyltransferase [Verrucomicrobiae bacterium]